MGFWKTLLGLEEDEKGSQVAIETKKETLFVTRDEEKDFENSMYGKLQQYKVNVAYIEEVFPSEGYDLRRQIDLILQLLEKSNSEEDEDVKKVFETLEEQYAKMRRLADGEYTIRQLIYQTSEMDKRFDEAGLKEKGLTLGELENFRKYIDLIQEKVNKSDREDEKPLLTKVQRQRFNSVSLKAEYRLKMLELMHMQAVKGFGTKEEENPFAKISEFKQTMFSGYFMEDARLVTDEYNTASKYEKLYIQFYYNIFRALDEMAKVLSDKAADASMVGDFSWRELFDSKDNSIDSFDFLKRFANFKLNLNDVRYQITTLDDLKLKREEKEAADRAKKQAEEAKRIATEEAERRRKEKEKAEREAKAKAEEAERLSRIEKNKNMTSEEIAAEIYRIEHDLSATGSRFVNILDLQKEIARTRGLLDTEAEVQREDLSYKVVSISELEELLEKLDEAGTNYIVFPDCKEFKNGGYLVIVSKSDEDMLKNNNSRLPYRNRDGASYAHSSCIDECFGKYPASIIRKLSSKLKARYDNDFKDNLSFVRTGDGLYKLDFEYRSYQTAEMYKEDKKKIRQMLLEVREELERGGNDSIRLKDVLCYIELRANENIIPILEAMKKAKISAFLEPVPKAKRNENNRDNIRVYFRRDDLSKYYDTVYEDLASKKRYILVNWGEDASIGEALVKVAEWPTVREKD